LKRAGSAVGLRPAPKARSAAHPQERQHSAAEGGTRDRVRPAGALICGACAAITSGIVTYAVHGISDVMPGARLCRAPGLRRRFVQRIEQFPVHDSG
jgi:hypothetical protein